MQSWLAVVAPEDRDALNGQVTRLFAAGGEYEQEYRVQHRDLGERWLRGRGRLELDASGKPSRFFGIDVDITESKRIGEELRLQRKDLDRAQAVAGVGSWRLDVRRNELKWSAENHRIFGVPKGMPMTYGSFLEVVHPDDRDYVDAEWTAALSGKPYDIEHRIIVDGQVKWVRERATLEFDQNGKLIGGFGTTQDITEKKKAERELWRMQRLMAEGQRIAHLGSWEYKAATQQTVWSDEEKCIYGLDPSSPAPSYEEMLLHLIHPEDAEELDRQFREAMARGAVFENEHRIVRPDGTIRWIHNRAYPSFDYDGAVAGYIGATLDITERKQMLEELGKANASLEQKVAERTAELALEMQVREDAQLRLAHVQRVEATGRLAGGLAHDFNNTLAAISAQLEFAQPRIVNEEAAESIKAALDAVSLGASLNRRLLSVAAKRQRPLCVEAPGAALLPFLSVLDRMLGADITITRKIEPDLWFSRFDPGEFEAAILNLAINARDAMPSGGSLIVEASNVSLYPSSMPSMIPPAIRQFVRISVRDTGSGMTPEVASRACEPFYTTKDATNGTGLGLSSVDEFVRASGGFLRIDSTVGLGTEVALYLPRARPSETAPGPPSLRRNAAPLGDGEHVLLVDDDDRVLEAQHKLVEGLGYAALNAKTGIEALSALHECASIRVVVSDIVMPGGMSGLDLARAIRELYSDVEVILVSGYSHEVHGRPDEVKLLRKPCSRTELADALWSALHEPRRCTSPEKT